MLQNKICDIMKSGFPPVDCCENTNFPAIGLDITQVHPAELRPTNFAFHHIGEHINISQPVLQKFLHQQRYSLMIYMYPKKVSQMTAHRKYLVSSIRFLL